MPTKNFETEKKEKVPAKRKKRQVEEPEPYWKMFVDTFFEFCKEKFGGEVPSFDGSAPRDLKSIVISIRNRANLANVVWDEGNAQKRFLAFLNASYCDLWLRQNFILFNINRQKDKIFFKISNPDNGQNKQNNSYWRSIGLPQNNGSEVETPL